MVAHLIENAQERGPSGADNVWGSGFAVLPSPPQETSPVRAALVALYNATDGPNWTNNTNWLSDQPVGEWHGVTTNADGRVVMLELLDNGLNGRIPAALGSLTYLENLLLGSSWECSEDGACQAASPSANRLSGEIPSELGSLSKLRHLFLAYSQLSGEIPSELGSVAGLDSLYLSGNPLIGCIPARLWDVPENDLDALGLSACGETAASPARAALVALYNATDGPNWQNNTNWLSDRPLSEWHGVTTDANGRVIGLNLNTNHLVGKIPREVGDLDLLRVLDLSNDIAPCEKQGCNRLSGKIPAELGRLKNLRYLNLSINELSGEIPEELGELANLQRLGLSYNGLSGEMPAELGQLSNLTHLFLEANRLSGRIPAELGNLTGLRVLILFSNRLSGELPAQLGNLANLESMQLGANELSGQIPAQIGRMTNLTGISLHKNRLSGAIPAELGRLTRLESLWLQENELSGAIPSELGGLSNLESLILDGNQLRGTIPAELGKLSRLKWLTLGENSGLSGPLPDSLTGLNSLEVLGLAGTQLCAPKDDAFQAWLRGIQGKDGVIDCEPDVPESPDRDALVALYNATNGDGWEEKGNWLSDRPLSEWHGVTMDGDGRVTVLALHRNQLSGQMPAELGNLANLHQLYLYGNRLSGEIPAELGSLANLVWLELHSNRLSGEIPASLGNLANLVGLVLHSNRLSGEIPASLGNLANLHQLDLYSNTGLAGPLPGSFSDLNALERLWLSDTGLCAPTDDVFQAWLTGVTNKIGVTNCVSTATSSDRDALVALYNATNGGEWEEKGNWLSDQPIDAWYGVTTDDSGRVTGLDLRGNDLHGELPTELGDLSELEELELWGNSIVGGIPSELGNLAELRVLDLGENQLRGEIPAELAGLSELESLYLGGDFHDLTGCIPVGLRDVPDNDLDRLDLPDCDDAAT